MSLLPVPYTSELAVGLAQLEEEAADYASNARAASTLKAYSSDWRAFTSWCRQHDLTTLPADPTVVALYLTDAARTLKVATLGRRLSSIAVAHAAAGEANPTQDVRVRATWAGIRRSHGTAQQAKAALLTADIRAIVSILPDSLLGRRDACLLLVGFAGAFRRSELVALDVADVVDSVDGLVVTIRRSKTDQLAEGRQIGIPFGSDPQTCPVRAFRAWLEAAGPLQGALFRPVSRHGHLGTARLSDRAVALVVKRTAKLAGLDPSVLAGHSLRAGFATSAAQAGVSDRSIMTQTGHKSQRMLNRYIRQGTLFTDNAAAQVGL